MTADALTKVLTRQELQIARQRLGISSWDDLSREHGKEECLSVQETPGHASAASTAEGVAVGFRMGP